MRAAIMAELEEGATCDIATLRARVSTQVGFSLEGTFGRYLFEKNSRRRLKASFLCEKCQGVASSLHLAHPVRHQRRTASLKRLLPCGGGPEPGAEVRAASYKTASPCPKRCKFSVTAQWLTALRTTEALYRTSLGRGSPACRGSPREGVRGTATRTWASVALIRASSP